MQYRPLGKTGWKVSEISFGTWAIGGSWGKVDDRESMAALHAAIDAGVNFLDTADVYGMGRSERLIAQLKRERKEQIVVATKAGRKLPAQTVAGYTRENLTGWVEESLRNLETDCLDLLQLHCPPTELYYKPEVFDYLDDLVTAGKLRFYGVSVERVEEALKESSFRAFRQCRLYSTVFGCGLRGYSLSRPGRSKSECWRECRWRADYSPGNLVGNPSSRRRIIAISTGTARLSMWERHFRASITILRSLP
jgi:aryl-alcohol dehydrogenase-like predicted oxidoreductase